MIVTHYTPKPFTLDRTRTYEQSDSMKPQGLWVGVDGVDDWPMWCREEQFRLERLEHQTSFVVGEAANILTLTTKAQVLTLAERFPHPIRRPYLSALIDWAAVAAEYDGIIITPYQWAARLNPRAFWYYGWDCASGCIWNLTALEELSVASGAVVGSDHA